MMKRNRIFIAWMTLLILLLTALPMQASAATLTIESVVPDHEEIYVGDTVKWTVNVTGGTAPYTYAYGLRRKPIYRSIIFDIPESNLTTDSNVYEYVLDGWVSCYMLDVTVTDAKGKKANYHSDPYMLKGGMKDKLEEIVAECAPDTLSDYEKALNLYKWLCDNAEYDYTYKWHSPEGVLRYGTGVCDSFAQAYKALLDEANVESQRVIGSGSSGEGHTWVMVKLDGEWYHMDPTWDEANDFYFYFGLNTEWIERDHVIEYIYTTDTLEEIWDVPVTTATKYNYVMNHAHIMFSDVSELNDQFDALSSKDTTLYLYCIGTVSYSQFRSWFSENYKAYGLNSSYTYKGSNPLVWVKITRPMDIALPTQLREIEDEAFAGNAAIATVYASGDQLTTIGSRAFADCINLNTITLPGSITYIADDAFEGCDPSMTIRCPRNSYVTEWFSNHGFYYRIYMD